MKKTDLRISKSLFSFRTYGIIFLSICFVVTCCFLLFLSFMELDEEKLRYSAALTFGNILFLSFCCTLIDGIRRKLTVERPVRRILNATSKLTHGDFSVRIAPLHPLASRNEFDAIIEDFNKMAEELSGIETLRTDFIASVSHEIKTPLAVMQNYATILQSPDLSEAERMEFSKSIVTASQKLSALITNILKLNKLENQQIFPDNTPFDLGEQLRECILDFEDSWEAKGLNIVTDISDFSIRADAELLSLVWNNLLSNAIKFTDPGGTITISLAQSENDAIVTISDTGCGISPKDGKHIFDKFYQGDQSHQTQGNGLGLALVKRVVDILGGEISVESQLGHGSSFTLKL